MRWATSLTAWFWSLQFAFLNPVLAVLLTTEFGASGSQAGIVLALYNAAGFLASVVIPAATDRRGNYVAGMVFSALCGLAFVGVLLATDSFVVAAVGMALLGAPTGVGATLLFAQLRHAGAAPDEVVRTRAVVSFAWVVGPPLSTLVTSVAPGKTVLVVIGGIGTVNLLTSVLAARTTGAPRPTREAVTTRGKRSGEPATTLDVQDRAPRVRVRLRDALRTPGVWTMVAVFVALQVLNSAAVTTMGLFVTTDLHAPLAWAGAALGLSALAEIPALLVIGRLMRTWSARTLLLLGSSVGAVSYLVVAIVHVPLVLVAVQPLNAWFFATIAGVGLTEFQEVIPAPGLAAGLFANTRQAAAVLSGGLIALVAQTPGGYGTLYWTCAAGAACIAGFLSAARSRARRQRASLPV